MRCCKRVCWSVTMPCLAAPSPPRAQAAQQHLQRIKQFRWQRRSSAAGDEAAAAAGAAGGLPPAAQPKPKRQLFPMQIQLAADDVALRFEHHPLEVRPGGVYRGREEMAI